MPRVTDPDIAKQVDELADLKFEIKQVTEKLQILKNRSTEIEDVLRPLLEELEGTNERILETEKSIAVIERRGYARSGYSYKQAYELALSKVNKTIKKILEDSLNSTKTLTSVASNISSRHKEESYIVENLIQRIISKVTGFIRRIVNKIKFGNKELDRTISILQKLGKG